MALLQPKGITANMAATVHLQMDGQSECSIQTRIRNLSPAIQKEPENWDRFFPTVELELNASKQESTRMVPIEVDLGWNPKQPLNRERNDLAEKHETAADDIERQQAFLQVARDRIAAAGEAQRSDANTN